MTQEGRDFADLAALIHARPGERPDHPALPAAFCAETSIEYPAVLPGCQRVGLDFAPLEIPLELPRHRQGAEAWPARAPPLKRHLYAAGQRTSTASSASICAAMTLSSAGSMPQTRRTSGASV